MKETEIVNANISNPTLKDICLILYLIPNVVTCDTLLLWYGVVVNEAAVWFDPSH